MSYVRLQSGFPWPADYQNSGGGTLTWTGGSPSLGTSITVDATGEMGAIMGHIYINGAPAAAKTLSSAGGKIYWNAGAVTFANAGTTLRIGVQDVSASAGPVARPDESWTSEPYDDLVGGTDTITATALNTLTISAGSRSITHGDYIAVVWDMTARAGADSVIVRGASIAGASSWGRPSAAQKTASWAAAAACMPIVLIEFDDGTLGWFDLCIPASTMASENWQDSTNPDERGNIFTVPFKCYVDAFLVTGGANNNAAGDFSFKLYSDPTGTPTQLASVDVLGEQMGVASSTFGNLIVPFARQELVPGTTYAVAAKATGTSAYYGFVATLANAAHRVAMGGGTGVAYATRNNSSGAFSTTTTKRFMAMAVRVSEIDDGASSAVAPVIGG